MIFASLPLAEAEGAILAHGLAIADERWAKGRILTAADIATASAAGLASLTVARLAADDVAEDDAAAALAAALAGTGVTALPAAHGRANLAAAQAGILCLDAAMVAAINSIDEALTLATLARQAPVSTGEIVATVKVIRYAVAGDALTTAIAAARPLAIAGFRPLAVTLIATSLPGLSAKTIAKTARVTRERVEALGCRFTEAAVIGHDAAALAAALVRCDADIILIAGASATVDRGDVIPAAIVAAGGMVERLGMPVDPGNLLVLGGLGQRPVIGLPGCARSPKRNGFDIILENLVAGLAVTSASIAAMGAGGLLPEAERPQPRAAQMHLAGPTGAIILAAGRSSRMGAAHKLLELWRGKPLVAHVADAVAAAGLPPPIVVLGARAADVRSALGDRPAQFIFAADHADGLAHSLRAGIAAVPAGWAGALVCLGDMPRVEPGLLHALAAAPGLAVPVWDGRSGNPVRWPRGLFPRLQDLVGDVGGKAILAEQADALTTVTAPSDAIFDDIDTPAALTALRQRR